MTTETFTAPLVGMHFRPPAKALLAALPAGCPLRLEQEPENPYDANAIKVLVASADIPASQHDKLTFDLPMFGFSLEDILAQPEWHLGYIARDFAAKLAIAMDQGLKITSTTLAFDEKGKGQVLVEWEG